MEWYQPVSFFSLRCFSPPDSPPARKPIFIVSQQADKIVPSTLGCSTQEKYLYPTKLGARTFNRPGGKTNNVLIFCPFPPSFLLVVMPLPLVLPSPLLLSTPPSTACYPELGKVKWKINSIKAYCVGFFQKIT
jgi:hypothetical protein